MNLLRLSVCGTATFLISLCLTVSSAVHAQAEPSSDSGWEGSGLLQAADKMEKEATERIKKGSALRKAIKQKRQEIMALPVGDERSQALSEIEAQVKNSLALQKQGGAKRKEAAKLRLQAVDSFAIDMQRKWPNWISTLAPIELSDTFRSDAPAIGAHNSRTRSVHPNKQNLAGVPQTSTAKSMTLALPELSGQQLPEGLDTRSFAISRERQFVAHIEVDKTSVESGDSGIALNELHRWHLVLSDVNGKAIAGANIHYRGHMPGHVHGLPTQPRINGELADGVYLISGVKFQMRGWWVIELQLQADGFRDDSIRFNLSL